LVNDNSNNEDASRGPFSAVEGDAKTELLKMNKREKQFKCMECWRGEWGGLAGNMTPVSGIMLLLVK